MNTYQHVIKLKNYNLTKSAAKVRDYKNFAKLLEYRAEASKYYSK